MILFISQFHYPVSRTAARLLSSCTSASPLRVRTPAPFKTAIHFQTTTPIAYASPPLTTCISEQLPIFSLARSYLLLILSLAVRPFRALFVQIVAKTAPHRANSLFDHPTHLGASARTPRAALSPILQKKGQNPMLSHQIVSPVSPSSHLPDRHRSRNWNLSTFFSAMPVPLATARSGSSATWNCICILSVSLLASPLSSAPPPAR